MSQSTTKNNQPSIFVSCDYDEYNPWSYRGLLLDFDTTSEEYVKPERFFTGNYNFLHDLNQCQTYLWRLQEEGYRILFSSSIDNYKSDLKRAYLDGVAY